MDRCFDSSRPYGSFDTGGLDLYFAAGHALEFCSNLADNLPGGTFRGVQLYLWKKRGVFKTLVSRHYGPRNTIPSSPNCSELKLAEEAIAEIEYCFEGLKPYLKPVR